MTPILTISDMQCGYLLDKPVLEIPVLTIPAGKLIFVIGASGGGKSTLLEALGLMNNTILGAASVHFHEVSGEAIALDKLWSASSNEIDAFRKRHFSFIFQKTNLMPNFTCGENMLLPALFKGQAYEDVEKKVLDYMEKLGLEPTIFNNKISNISGGQKQRLAFIRAMATDFNVLFGDEPTGNLDPGTARAVMTVLKRHLVSNDKTGIVVSHDIGLAAEFADMIIPITMEGEGENRMGMVKQENLLYSDEDRNWSDKLHTVYNQIEDHLKQLIA